MLQLHDVSLTLFTAASAVR